MTAFTDCMWLVAAALVAVPVLAEPLPESWRLPRPQDHPPRSYNYPGGGGVGGGGQRPGAVFPPGYPGPAYGQGGGGGGSWPRPQHPDYEMDAAGVLGAPCDYDEDCPENAYCRGQQSCECKRPYRASADGARCLATVGAPCSSRYDCTGLGPGADCDQDVCHCGTGYVPSAAADGSCVAGAQRLNDTCELDLQCETLGTGVTCASGKCQCVPGRHAYNDRCIANVALRAACSQTHECFIGEGYQGVVECQSGICRCKDQYMEIDGKCSPSGATRLSAVIPSLILVLLITFSI